MGPGGQGIRRKGELIEYDRTSRIFSNPRKKETEDYVRGRFGYPT